MQFDAAMLMSFFTRELPFSCPSAVAIHDDGDVPRGGSGVAGFVRRCHARTISALDFHDRGFLCCSNVINPAGIAVGDFLEPVCGAVFFIF